MICLRCGYCCISLDVTIIVDIEKGISEDNMAHKSSGKHCSHLQGNKVGEYSCAIHDQSWYEETPCHSYTQIETSVETLCRIGVYILNA